MRLEELRGRRVALLGFGEDNRAALPHITEVRPQSLVLVDDDPTRRDDAPSGLTVIDLDRALDTADVVVRSPGFPRYRPVLQEAIARGVDITTPTDLWMGTFGAKRQVVAVTGTKGKSTTTELIEHFARKVGLDLATAGNIGIPVFSDDWNHQAAAVAIEISSYQAVDLHHLPDIAVLTSLAEDHLDWHQGYERYVADKLRVLQIDGRRAAAIFVAASDPTAVEATRSMAPLLVASPASGELPRHRVQNAALAAEVVRALSDHELTDHDVVEAASHSLPGRLDLWAERAGVRWIDDALASNPFAGAAGLAWARTQDVPTIVILGGADRGVDPRPLVDEVGQWPPGRLRAVTVPDNGEALAHRSELEVLAVCNDLTEAVGQTADALPSGGIALFSPAAPTPTGRGTWRARSLEFRSAIDGLFA